MCIEKCADVIHIPAMWYSSADKVNHIDIGRCSHPVDIRTMNLFHLFSVPHLQNTMLKSDVIDS